MSLRPAALALLVASCASAAPAPAPRDGATDATAVDVAPVDVARGDVPRGDAAPRDAVTDAGAMVEAPCSRPTAERPPGSVCVRVVRGRVTDLEGAPRVDIPVTVCGPACWVGRTDAEGRFAVEVGDFIPLAIYSVLAHGRPDHASSYVPMPRTVGPGDEITLAETMVVPRYVATGDVVRAGTARAGEVAVTLPPDAGFELDIEDLTLGELGTRLRATPVPVDRAPPFAAEGGARAVWALAPFNLQATRPMPLRLPNTAGLAPGAAVDLFVMGWDVLPPRSNAGRAVDAARGRVSADGTFIETDPGEGVAVLTWVGVRARRD